MLCLKCGKETKDGQVFCDQCLSQMDAYPVKPEIHIQLPSRPAKIPPKKAGRKKHALSPEEQVVCLKARVRRLIAATVLLALMLCATAGVLLYTLTTPEDTEWGKNYTVEIPFG